MGMVKNLKIIGLVSPMIKKIRMRIERAYGRSLPSVSYGEHGCGSRKFYIDDFVKFS